MRVLDFLAQPRILPGLSLAQDAYFLHGVTAPSAPRRPLLRVYDVPGDGIALGRYHLPPKPVDTADGPWLYRRRSGGRAVPFGEGFLGVALILPHRSALLSVDPFALAPHQVLNRYVRGILDACKVLGLNAFYPGRDAVTSGGRVMGLISFEVDGRGATLVETILAVGRDFSLLPLLLDVADPEGAIKAEMPEATHMTCVERELGRTVEFEELAEAVRRGYEQQFQLTLEPHLLAAAEQSAIDAIARERFAADRWLRARQMPPGPWRHASTRGQLGIFETYVDVAQGSVRDVRLTGDFIANSPAMDQLESALRACAPEWHAIHAIVSAVFAQPANFMLGIGKLSTIADTIMRAIGT